MTKLLSLILFVVLVPATSMADKLQELMLPSARIEAGNNVGSGTAVATDLFLGTYVLTNMHVVFKNLDDVTVQFYLEEEKHQATVVKIDKVNDLALLLVSHRHLWIAKLGRPPDMFDPAYCVGASLGKEIAPSRGEITGVGSVIKSLPNRASLRTDCKIISGNSGGGLFVKQNGVWKLVGVTFGLLNMRRAFSSQPVPFLGLAVPIGEIRNFINRDIVPVETQSDN